MTSYMSRNCKRLVIHEINTTENDSDQVYDYPAYILPDNMPPYNLKTLAFAPNSLLQCS